MSAFHKSICSSSDKVHEQSVNVTERPVATFEQDDGRFPCQNNYGAGPKRGRTFGLHLRLQPQPSRFAPGSKITNRDFDPTAPSERTWSYMSFLVFWLADAWAVSMLQLGSSIAAVTLNWQNAVVAIV